MVQALILAGGRGTRLRPLTDLYPKPLLYLPGGTLLDHLLTQLERLAITDIAIVVNYKADAIARHIHKRRHIRLILRAVDCTICASRHPRLQHLPRLARYSVWRPCGTHGANRRVHLAT